MPKRNPTKTDSKRKRQNGAKTELSQNGFKTDSKRSQQSIEKISKNRYYPLKFLEFRVESPKGNEIKEILNFKETTFFDMSSAQPADFRKSDKVSKNPFCSGHHVLFGVRFGDDERFDAVLGVLFGDALLAVVVFVVGVR